MKQETIKKVELFLNELDTEICIIDYIEIDEIDLEDPFQSIVDQLNECNAFDIEIIYYYKAMEYLTKNDTSLKESINIAIEYGYSIEDINSEFLASLLASKLERENFNDLESEINDFFEKIKLEIEQEEEEENI
jgi:hypothetical protein